MDRRKLERIGETMINNQGEEMGIIEYNNRRDITITFKSTKEIIKTSYDEFKKGKVKSHFSPTVFGVGITGITQITDENKKQLDSYMCWVNMLRRCYTNKYQERFPTYIGCTVSEEFKIYAKFKKFYDGNYYEIKELCRTELDKDILHKGNKVYSKENCVFVPQVINGLFIKQQNRRGNLPIGVSLNYKNYQAKCNDGIGNAKRLGTYKTPELAFNVYKDFKEKLIKEVAEKYKSQIPIKLYDAMYKYEIEITD